MRSQLPPKILNLWNAEAMVQDTGTYNSSDIVNALGYQTATFLVKIASEVGTATFDFKLQQYFETDGAWYDIPGASLAQQTAETTISLVIGVGLTAVANRVVSQPVPHTMRAVCTIGDATTEGYTVTVDVELN